MLPELRLPAASFAAAIPPAAVAVAVAQMRWLALIVAGLAVAIGIASIPQKPLNRPCVVTVIHGYCPVTASR